MGLIHVFGNKPVPKVLDFFRINSFWDYSLKDISRETEVSHRTLQEMIPRLVKNGVLVQTRTEGKARLYKFNLESRLAKHINRVAIEIDLQYGESLAKGRKPGTEAPRLPLPVSR